ncbi:MAG: ABC transporter ATP-binding protein, partial [Bacteroidota bacterium]
MADTNLISINKLSCSYSRKDEQKVLFIENLELEKGKIIFLLGASGTGKSTLLETLGLMNNTISSGTVVFNNAENDTFDFALLWKNNSDDKINLIRKKFLSFIFQETNLMENFTAYENICLSQMIKSNVSQEKAMRGAAKLMEQVKLPESEVSFDKLSVNLSGGQRQRVSFVRALNTDFKVLLCDEPTGNLDEVNAHELIQIVKQNLDHEKSAILVSHDINLALKYADQIILITKNSEKKFGEILKENIFDKSHWESLKNNELSVFRDSLVQSFKGNNTREKPKEVSDKSKYENAEYRNLFIRKEGKILMGKSYLNLAILITIIFITLLAVGFANGTLNYLDTKLKDKFVNWLTIAIPASLNSQEQVAEFTDNLNEEGTRKTYLIDTVTTYKITWLPFFRNDSTNEPLIAKGRLLSEDDPLTKHLFDEKNLVPGGKDFKG